MDEILRAEHIVKIYDNGVMANKDINFAAQKGEIHAICGENGAGKSTFMKMLYGKLPDIADFAVRFYLPDPR